MGRTFRDSFNFSNVEKCRKEFISDWYISDRFKFIDDCKNSDGYFQILWDTKNEKYVCFYYMLKYSKGEWGYKDLDDSMGPGDPCPLKMLKYLEKNDKSKMHKYSIQWIEESKKAIAEKKKAQEVFAGLKVGSILTLNNSFICSGEKFKECKILSIDKNNFIFTSVDNKNLDGVKFRFSKSRLKKVGFSVKDDSTTAKKAPHIKSQIPTEKSVFDW